MLGLATGSVVGGRYTLSRAVSGETEPQVWLAQDTVRDLPVTIVALSSSHPQAAAVIDAARRAAGIDNARLVRILDVGTEGGVSYLVEENLTGAQSLTQLAAHGGLAAEEVRRLTGEAATALDSAGRRGLHHLGLTPDSLLRLPDGSVKIAGLATQAALAGQDHIGGERALRRDARGLVALAYAGLTGRWPYAGDVGLEPAPRTVGGVPRPSEIAVGVPADLDTICRLTLNEDLGPISPGGYAAQIAPWSSLRTSEPPVNTAVLRTHTDDVAGRRFEEAYPTAPRHVAPELPRGAGVGAGTTGTAARMTAAGTGANAARGGGPTGTAGSGTVAAEVAAATGATAGEALALGAGATAAVGAAGTTGAAAAGPVLAGAAAGTVAGTAGAARRAIGRGAASLRERLSGLGARRTGSTPRISADPIESPSQEPGPGRPVRGRVTAEPAKTPEVAREPRAAASDAAATTRPGPMAPGAPRRVLPDPAAAGAVLSAIAGGGAAVADSEPGRQSEPVLPSPRSVDPPPLQAPAPLLSPESGASPSRAQSRLVLLLFAGLTALALVLGVAGASRIGQNSNIEAILGPDPTAKMTSPSTSSSPTTSEAAGNEELFISGATGYDPEGVGGDENNDLGARVFDGDPGTFWQSEGYQGPNFGGLKSGVGLLVDMGTVVTPRQITLTFPTPNSFELYLSDEPDRAGARAFGQHTMVSGNVTVDVPRGTSGRYLIVWFTDAPQVPDGRYRATLAEIQVRG